MTATEAVALLAQGSLGSEELLDAQLARVDRFNGEINAVVAFDIERARARCREADAASAAGESWGDLHGLPMTIKDSFETEGLVTTSGAPELANHVPTTDADGVALLKDAGAIVFGKTNLPIYAGDIQSFNDVYGLTRNPWDLDRTVGGSSGGAAAGLAAGFSLLELGSDIGGSIRCPAHYCGVAGIKPSWWVLSRRGHIPGAPGAMAPTDLTVSGPMGRSVADLELAMRALTARSVFGVPGASLPAASANVQQLEGCRVALWRDDDVGPVSAATRHVFDALGGELEQAGAHVRTDVRPATNGEEWFAWYCELLIAAMASRFDEATIELMTAVAASGDAEATDPSLASARGATMSHTRWLELDERRHRLIRDWEALFDEVDIVLAPVAPGAAFPHDEAPMMGRVLDIDGVAVPALLHLYWAGLATLPYLPSTVVRAGNDESGLPIGVQVIAPRWADRSTLAFARHVEQIAGGFVPPPRCA